LIKEKVREEDDNVMVMMMKMKMMTAAAVGSQLACCSRRDPGVDAVSIAINMMSSDRPPATGASLEDPQSNQAHLKHAH